MHVPCAPRRLIGSVLLGCALLASIAQAQAPREPARAPGQVLTQAEARLLQALATDPRTAPFVFTTAVRGGRVKLSGRVGSGSYHAAAIEVAVNSGIPFTDRLVIDTAEMARVPRLVPAVPVAMPYPYPLFAGPFDPFLGLEPPLITYPPWWGAMSARRLAENSQRDAEAAAPAPDATVAPAPPAVAPATPNPAPARPVPPPPTPGNVDAPAAGLPPPAAGPTPLSSKVLEAIRTRRELDGLKISVANRGGDVTLTGDVPGPVEALSSFAAARGTPGVARVEDQLRYPVPPPEHPNPLLAVDRPDDLAAFLRYHIERQLRDAATIRSLSLTKSRVHIEAERARDRDAAQVEAVLRSTPMVRGFDLSVNWQGPAEGAR